MLLMKEREPLVVDEWHQPYLRAVSEVLMKPLRCRRGKRSPVGRIGCEVLHVSRQEIRDCHPLLALAPNADTSDGGVVASIPVMPTKQCIRLPSCGNSVR